MKKIRVLEVVVLVGVSFLVSSCDSAQFWPDGGFVNETPVEISKVKLSASIAQKPSSLSRPNDVSPPFTTSGRLIYSNPSPTSCGGQLIFSEKLVGIGGLLDSGGQVQFVHSSDPHYHSSRRDYAAGFVAFAKLSLVDIDTAAIKKTYALNLADPSLTPEKDTFYSGGPIFCDEKGASYLVAIKHRVVANTLGSHKTYSLQLIDEFAVFSMGFPESSDEVGLKKVKVVSGMRPERVLRIKNHLMLGSISNGQLKLAKLQIPNFNLVASNVIRLHHSNTESISRLFSYSDDVFFVGASWRQSDLFSGELVRVNSQNLEVDRSFAANSAEAGEDGGSDQIDTGHDLRSFLDFLGEGNDLYFLVSGVPQPGRGIEVSLIDVDLDDGSLNQNFHQTGYELVPGSNAEMIFFGEQIMVVFGYTDRIGVRALDKSGHLVKINKGKDFFIEGARGSVLDLKVVNDKLRVFFSRGGLDDRQHFNYFDLNLQ